MSRFSVVIWAKIRIHLGQKLLAARFPTSSVLLICPFTSAWECLICSLSPWRLLRGCWAGSNQVEAGFGSGLWDKPPCVPRPWEMACPKKQNKIAPKMCNSINFRSSSTLTSTVERPYTKYRYTVQSAIPNIILGSQYFMHKTYQTLCNYNSIKQSVFLSWSLTSGHYFPKELKRKPELLKTSTWVQQQNTSGKHQSIGSQEGAGIVR